jgi:hypothetical protein
VERIRIIQILLFTRFDADPDPTLANFSTIFASVNDTGEKFATGVNDTSGKFANGVKDAGGQLPPVSTTPAANNRINIRLQTSLKET